MVFFLVLRQLRTFITVIKPVLLRYLQVLPFSGLFFCFFFFSTDQLCTFLQFSKRTRSSFVIFARGKNAYEEKLTPWNASPIYEVGDGRTFNWQKSWTNERSKGFPFAKFQFLFNKLCEANGGPYKNLSFDCVLYISSRNLLSCRVPEYIFHDQVGPFNNHDIVERYTGLVYSHSLNAEWGAFRNL